MKLVKKILWLLVFAFIGIQFFRPENNISSTPSANHISKTFNVPADVQKIFDSSCNDCHSNNTRYPWYFNIQPVAWWMEDHVKDGKDELNLDEFSAYRLRRQFHKFEKIVDEIKDNEMPIASYKLVHRDAHLSPEQKETLIKWSEEMQNEMKVKYPPDSLKRRNG